MKNPIRMLRAAVVRSFFRAAAWLKAPRMIWGYRDSDGSWRRRTRISDTAVIYRRENIHIEDNVFVGHYAILDGTGGLRIGCGTQISAGAYLYTHSSHVAIRLLGDHYQEVPEDEKPAFSIRTTRIGRYVFVGAGAQVMPGVTVGDGAVIGARAVVTKDVPPFAVVTGIPAVIAGDVRQKDRAFLDDPKIKQWYDEWQNAFAADGARGDSDRTEVNRSPSSS